MMRSFTVEERTMVSEMLAEAQSGFPSHEQMESLSSQDVQAIKTDLYSKIDSVWRRTAEKFPDAFSYRYEQRPQ
jgi:hypothetical protein